MEENTSISPIENNKKEEVEIDLIAIIQRLWHKKVFILCVTAIFMAIGLMVALFSPEEYTASCTFVPQTNQRGGGQMSSLARLAGINLNNMNTAESLSPLVYPQILKNADFQKELMYSEFTFSKWNRKMTLIDYYTDPAFNKPSIFDYIKKYTIGLPGTIIGIFKQKAAPGNKPVDSLHVFSPQENICADIISSKIKLSINNKEGYIELVSMMPEARVAAEVAEKAFSLLETHIIEYKTSKSQNTLNYINSRLDEVKNKFDQKRLDYAKFQDANRTISTAVAQIKDEEFRREYELMNTIYNELAQQKVQIELQVKEDTPVLSIVRPVIVPDQRSKPKKAMLLILFTFTGGIIGCASMFCLDFMKKVGAKWTQSWK